MSLVPQVTSPPPVIVREGLAVLDLSEPEVACGQIDGSAPRRRIVVDCQGGRRSQHAAEMSTGAGFEVGNLACGVYGWVSGGWQTVGSLFSDAHTLPRSVQLSCPVADFPGLARAMAVGTPTVLDVRRHDERAGGGARDNLHVPRDHVQVRLGRVPHGGVWVSGARGYRASSAASVPARAGYHPILVDGPHDDPETAASCGLRSSPFPADRTMEEGATNV